VNLSFSRNPFGGARQNVPNTFFVQFNRNYIGSQILTFARGVSVQLSQNFHLSEFECKCGKCSETLISPNHIQKMQLLRDFLGRSIKVNCGYRCPAHNVTIEGSSLTSKHMLGQATDIRMDGVSAGELFRYILASNIDFRGMKRYNSFVHLDSREGPKWYRP
jgi:uncharacterized protein YcbK (DUF882 family)